jgi:DnaJ-domain-containing protein 1
MLALAALVLLAAPGSLSAQEIADRRAALRAADLSHSPEVLRFNAELHQRGLKIGASPSTGMTVSDIGRVTVMRDATHDSWENGNGIDDVFDGTEDSVIAFFEEVIAKIPPPAMDWTAFAAALKARVQPVDPYALLGVPPTAPDDEVKTAYREQQRLNHPDLVARMSPEIQKVAHERTQAINEAYRVITEFRRKK